MPWRQAPERIWWRSPDCPFFDPTLLSCAKKRGVEPPRRSCFRCAYRATEQKGCDPFDIPGVLISNCYPVERFYGFRQHSRSGLQLQTSLQLVQRSTCRAANLQSFAAARHFCSAKILAPSRVSQVCRTPYRQPLKSTNQRPTGNLPAPGSPRVPEGPRSLCLGNFFLTVDAVLLCAAKKNSDSRWRLCRLTDMGCRAGVGTTRLAGFCQFSPDPWVTHSSKKPHIVGSGK